MYDFTSIFKLGRKIIELPKINYNEENYIQNLKKKSETKKEPKMLGNYTILGFEVDDLGNESSHKIFFITDKCR